MTTLTADTLPDGLSGPAREFISQSHRLLIGAERPEAFVEVVSDFLERHEAFVVSRTETVIHP